MGRRELKSPKDKYKLKWRITGCMTSDAPWVGIETEKDEIALQIAGELMKDHDYIDIMRTGK